MRTHCLHSSVEAVAKVAVRWSRNSILPAVRWLKLKLMATGVTGPRFATMKCTASSPTPMVGCAQMLMMDRSRRRARTMVTTAATAARPVKRTLSAIASAVSDPLFALNQLMKSMHLTVGGTPG